MCIDGPITHGLGHDRRTPAVGVWGLILLVLAPAFADAAPPPVRLVVHESPAAQCASREALTARLASLLERDAFDSAATRRIDIRFRPLEGGLEADIACTGIEGQPDARRTLRTHGDDCEALLGAVALSVVLAVDPVRGLTLVAETPPGPVAETPTPVGSTPVLSPPPLPAAVQAPRSEATTPVGSVRPSDAKAPPVIEATDPPPVPLPEPEPALESIEPVESEAPPEGASTITDSKPLPGPRPGMHDGIVIGGGLVAGLGSGLGAELAAHLDWTVDVRQWAFGTYFRWAPNFEFSHREGTVDAELKTFGVHLCRRWRALTGCALGSGGIQFARGQDGNFDPAKRIDAPYLAVGTRGMLRLWSAGTFAFSTSLEVFAPLSRLRILSQGEEVWSTPPISGHLGLSVSYVLP